MQGHTERDGAVRVTAQLYVIGIRFKGVQGRGEIPQLRHIRLKELCQKTAENNIAVQRHADVVDADGQVLHNILPQRQEGLVVVFEALKKFL